MLRLTTALLALASAGAHAAPPPDALRFDSARVVDLSSPRDAAAGPMLETVALAPDDAAAILSAPAREPGDPQLPFAHDVFACRGAADCEANAERRLIDAEDSRVVREGGVLLVRTAGAAPLRFVDHVEAATATADGDATHHRYVGRVGPARLLHVEVQYQHDAPGAFLIGNDSIARVGGNIVYVHKGGDVAAFAPDGRGVVVLDPLNAPASVVYADLDTNGPRLALRCAATARDSRTLVAFKRWSGNDAFDVVLTQRSTDDEAQGLPLRIVRADGVWRAATTDAARLHEFDGFECRAMR